MRQKISENNIRQGKLLKAVTLIDYLIEKATILLIILALLLGAYSFWDKHQIKEQANSSEYEQYRPEKSENGWSLEELQKLNPEVLGWIKLKDSPIDYPFVQGKNNDKYLNTDAKGDFSMSGALFLHADNAQDLSDAVSIIYGHNMEGGLMFGSLQDFLKKDYFDKHKHGYIIYDGKMRGIYILGVAEVNAYDGEVYSGFKDKSHVDRILSKARQIRECEEKPERLLILSTCSPQKSITRLILMCKITDSVDPSMFEVDEEKNEDSINMIFILIIITAILLLILLILLLLYKRKKDRNEPRYEL